VTPTLLVVVAFCVVKFGRPSWLTGLPFSWFSRAVLAEESLAGPDAFGLPMKIMKLLPHVFAAVSGERNVEYGVV
jgi:hypothetical protein